MASGAAVCFPPFQSPSDPAAENQGGGGGSELASHDVVLRGDTSLGREAMGISCFPGPSESGAVGPVPSLSTVAKTLGLAPERSSLFGMGSRTHWLRPSKVLEPHQPERHIHIATNSLHHGAG